MSIDTFTNARQLSLSWASSIQSIPSYRTSWISTLILSSHLHLGLPSGLFPSSFPNKTLYTPPFSSVYIVSYYLIPCLLTYLLTYLLTPYSTALLEKVTGSQLVKKVPIFYGTRRFITAFTSARHLSLSWASSIQSILPHSTTWRSIYKPKILCYWYGIKFCRFQFKF